MSCTTVRFLDHLLPRNLLRNTLWCTGTRTGLLITVRAPKVRVESPRCTWRSLFEVTCRPAAAIKLFRNAFTRMVSKSPSVFPDFG
jgi:hypothetical protein